ncbi:MAG: 1,4-dihydroxy-6-naphthoate synthase [Alphaproteobacteria bacterium]|uniref:1,4-dihydroxy-6-naphtoate synthase n=1 Tax=Candidatus Nitrobium versatile TaxID=2884831 RepID=A0A953M0W5_9BACT|nr:1,4-dihydroxy-6-naphthoate synthase [Candidatus Nitrobium versatile]
MLQFHIMIRLGFSPCPNDTFIFYALAHRKTDARGLSFHLIIEDVETLNRLALRREAEVLKVSCHAYSSLRDDYVFLRSGGAMGRGCGPLLVAKSPGRPGDLRGGRIGIPGRLTTAFLLLQLFLSSADEDHRQGDMPYTFVEMPFHRIMGAVREGKLDAGLIIHESRFTYPAYGLVEIADLGVWWEQETGLPLPLGGIIAKKSLGPSVLQTLEELIRDSIAYSRAHEDEAMHYIKHHAQELSEEVIRNHIALYVNEYTLDSGDEGRAALEELMKRRETAPLSPVPHILPESTIPFRG